MSNTLCVRVEWFEQTKEKIAALESENARLAERLKLLEAVAEAAKRSYPTLHSHMIHCELRDFGNCSCGKNDNDYILGKALAALDAHDKRPPSGATVCGHVLPEKDCMQCALNGAKP